MATDLALFDILLSKERNTAERLKALADLRPFLESAEGITKLAAAAREEESKDVKRAMLTMLCSIDMARVSEHQPYIDMLASIACLEPERDLRRIAVARLAAIAPHNNDIQEILALTLINDLDTEIQLASIDGLGRAVTKTDDTLAALYAYLPVAAKACKRPLLEMVTPLPLPHNAKMLLHFLDPLEEASLRLTAINLLADMPLLPPEVVTGVTAVLPGEISLTIRAAVTRLLSRQQQVNPEIFAGIFTALEQMPDQPELLTLVSDRLTAFPELHASFIQLFSTTTSAALKMNLLSLLQHTEIPALIISALQDANPYVRQAALPLLAFKFSQWQEQLEPALAKIIREEPLIALRRAMADVMLQTGRKSAETENVLVELALTETDHGLKIRLAENVCQVVITDSNRQPLLRLFCEVMEGPFYPAALKDQVITRLQTFSFHNDPDFRQCLELLLEQAKDVYELERVYNLLITLKTDFSELAPVLLRLTFRHIGSYPQQPLHDWVQLLGKVADQQAEIRTALPYLIQLTGANWLLKKADKSEQTGAFLPAFKHALMTDSGTASFMGMKALITDAWNNRTIKKAELIELYRLLLRMPKSVGLIQLVLGIMTQGKLVTPELIDISLAYVLNAQDSGGIYEVQRYLEQNGFLDLSYRMRLETLFTQENFNRYMQYHAPDIQSKRSAMTMNDWEYAGWTCPYNGWPLAKLIFALEPGDLIKRVFNAPLPAGPADCSLQYLVLEHLFRNGGGKWANSIFKDKEQFGAFLSFLANNYRQLPEGDVLRDRMLCAFWKRWNEYVSLLNNLPIPPGLADEASIMYAGVCAKLKQLVPDFNGKQYPDVLKHMNKTVLQQHWPWTTDMWDEFAYKYFPVKDPDQDAAIALYGQAAKLMQAGKWNEGVPLLKELLVHYPHTRFAKEKLDMINKTIKEFEDFNK